MTNNLIRRRFEAFDRIKGFGSTHGGAFTAGSRGALLFTKMAEVAGAMRAAGADKLSSSGAYRGGSNAKLFWYGELQEDLEAIRDTASAIAIAEDTPEFDDQFRIPKTSAYEAMLAAARSFLQDATPHRDLFIEFELPADFLEDLAADIEEFENASDAQDAGLAGQVSGTADLAKLATEGMKMRKQLDAIVRNKFRANSGILAAWASAQHIERQPRAAEKPAPVA